MNGCIRKVVTVMLALMSGGGAWLGAQVELPMEDAEVLARAATLDIEERRYLTYLYARLAKPKVAQVIGRMVLAENPSDRQTLLVLASMAVEYRDGGEAVRLAEEFLGYYPGDEQGRYFLGAGYFLLRRYAEAERVLRELKAEQFKGRRFPYETDLAASALSAGQWYRAMLSYQELLRNHSLGDELRHEVREVLDGIYREHGPRAYARAQGIFLESGELWRGTAGHAMHVTGRHWWEVELHRDRVWIDAAPGLVERRGERLDATTRWRTDWNRRWRTWMGAGVGEDRGRAEARARYTLAPQRTVEGYAAVNARATDSLLLESIDGRANRAGFEVSWLAEADLTVLVQTEVREVRLAGARLGTEMSANLAVDHALWRAEPRWTVGYRGGWAELKRAGVVDPAVLGRAVPVDLTEAERQLVVDNLVATRRNRHGLAVTLADNLADAWRYRFTAGADYDFVREATGYNLELALQFWPRKSIELGLGGGYTSSADASNAGQDAIFLNLSLVFHY